MNKAIFLFALLSASTTNRSASGSLIEESGIVLSSNRRRLTYACNSKTNSSGGRRLISRLLLHPCNNQAQQSVSTNSLYNKNTSRGSNTFVNVTLGILAGVATLFGLLFLIDRETFKDVTGMEALPYYKFACNCPKRRVEEDDDEKDITPFEQDKYLTPETNEYLKTKQINDADEPKRRLRIIFSCCLRPKVDNYTDADKYHVASFTSDNGKSVDGQGQSEWFTEIKGELSRRFDKFRRRLCWRPTKKYGDRDKYDVEGADDDDDMVKYAASSYESATPDAAPW